MPTLFLGHEASRTGAPLLLLELLRWMSVQSSIEPTVLLWRGGEMIDAYGQVVPTRVLCRSLAARVLDRLGLSALVHPGIARQYPPARYPLLYVNTVASVRLLRRFAAPGRRVVHHVHELAHATRQLGVIQEMRRAVACTDLYLAASQAVADFLRGSIGVPAERIMVIHEFAINLPKSGFDAEGRRALRFSLGFPDDCILVVMSGSPESRKGTDLFVRLAELVHQRPGGTRLRFLWLGGSSIRQRPYQRLVRRLGLDAICRFQPAVGRPQDWLGAADLFALTSREDPFSVVMLEAAAAGVPVLCFADSGGAPELVADDAGVVVPSLDLPAMAEACLRLAEDDSLRQRLGACARLRVQQQYLLHHQAPRILAALERLPPSR